MNTTKYIGIPFKGGGRELDGLDCWGLVRAFYRDELNIQLPSFDSSYNITDDQRIAELIAQYSEGWDQVDVPVAGDVVLFKIFGEPVHLGIMLDNTQFLHIREGGDSVVENVVSVRWKKRVSGYFRYNQNKSVVLNAVPHPLKTVAVTSFVSEGTTLQELYNNLNKQHNINPEFSGTAVIMVNSEPVPRHLWETTILKASDKVEYRGLAGKETIRLVALVALAYFAPQIAFKLGTAVGATTATSFAAWQAVAPIAANLTAAAVTIAGSFLINAIAPIRPPSQEDPGSPVQQNLISGSSNPYTPYGAIPVVLGKVRYTPPLGAKSFITYTYPNDNNSYLNMMLVWGYGPLSIDDSSMRVGDVPLSDYDLAPGNIGKKTLDRKTVPTTQDLELFDSIYGNDVDQFFKNIEMVGPDYNAALIGQTEELPPYYRPIDSNGQAIQNLLYNSHLGQPVAPLPPLPDDTIYDLSPS